MTTISIRLFVVVLLIGVINAKLDPSFYEKSCPKLLDTIKNEVKEAVQNDTRMAASLLRLHFHDCFVNGCDASIILENGEQIAVANNNSARGFEVINTIKTQVEKLCPGVVSCADILAVAARDSVNISKGPTWPVPLGRKDSLKPATLNDVNKNIPAPTLNLSGLITSFSNKGFTPSEMVSLSGAHTIGKVRCVNIRTRIYNETNIDTGFARTKQENCPLTGGDNNVTGLDSSPYAFDSCYFQDLTNLEGMLHSDQQLFNKSRQSEVDNLVKDYSTNVTKFFEDFALAMIKMSRLGEGSTGEIRRNCTTTN